MTHSRPLVVLAASAAGGSVAIGLMIAIAEWSGFPLVMVPFATSIVLVMGSPEAGPAQPRALVGGHLVATLVGVVMVKLLGPGPWAAAASVGVAMAAMHLTRTFHPPAGIDPLVAVLNDVSWSFVIAPVAIGALTLAVFAFAWHGLTRRGAWPARWW